VCGTWDLTSALKKIKNHTQKMTQVVNLAVSCTACNMVLDNVKIGNLKRKNRDHKKVLNQDEDAGNLQILLHLRSLFWLHDKAFAIIPFTTYLHTIM